MYRPTRTSVLMDSNFITSYQDKAISAEEKQILRGRFENSVESECLYMYILLYVHVLLYVEAAVVAEVTACISHQPGFIIEVAH